MPVLLFFIMRKLAFCLTLTVCAPHPSPRDAQIAAASTLTVRYAASAMAKWSLRGSAAGADCNVLLVETPVVLDDALVEAIHYGTGAYAVIDGGVRRFTRERAFRAVVYRDRTGRVWTYGDLAQSEAEGLQRCR
jgi:hypothetical protein